MMLQKSSIGDDYVDLSGVGGVVEVDVAGLGAAWPGLFSVQLANYIGNTAVAGRGPANVLAGV